ncbi:aldehyde dehydrogenase family protein [Candidatus Riflebacteria bacterium]
MLKKSYPYYLANKAVYANEDLVVCNKYNGEIATKVALADAAVIDSAITKACEAFHELRTWPAHRKKQILLDLVSVISERHEELASALCIEAGKPIKDSRGEVTRAIDTFQLAAEECTRNYGEYMPLDISPRADGYQAIWKRFPIGPLSFISPFNFPLNLVAHKIGPALAIGCPFVLKPASATPVGALILGEILAASDLPAGAFSILPCKREGADLFTTDERFKLLSFTGSPEVGWELKKKAGKKKVVLELGGNAACIVDSDADLDFASNRVIIGAFYQSGQSCISVQRIYIHQNVYEDFKKLLLQKTSALKSGDPMQEENFIGPMISEKEAIRVEEWVEEAIEQGAKVLVGGKREGRIYQATLLENVAPDLRVSAKEVFGPVALLHRYENFKDVCKQVNASEFGLQAGIFSNNIHRAFYAFENLDVGGVVINDVPSIRVDSMPYGGIKDSGLGREGIRFAMEDMSEIRLLVLNKIGQQI